MPALLRNCSYCKHLVTRAVPNRLDMPAFVLYIKVPTSAEARNDETDAQYLAWHTIWWEASRVAEAVVPREHQLIGRQTYRIIHIYTYSKSSLVSDDTECWYWLSDLMLRKCRFYMYCMFGRMRHPQPIMSEVPGSPAPSVILLLQQINHKEAAEEVVTEKQSFSPCPFFSPCLSLWSSLSPSYPFPPPLSRLDIGWGSFWGASRLPEH